VTPALPDDVFCVLPWVHVNGSVDGVWGRCCVDGSAYYDELYQRDKEPSFSLRPDALGCVAGSRYAQANPDRVFGIEAAFNSPNLRQTRLAMLARQRVPACSYCYQREDGGGRSYRQHMNDWFSQRVNVADLVGRTELDGALPNTFPVFLDIRFGNSCNLRCIMCGYPVSSRWGLDKHPSWAPAHVDPYREDEELWAELRAHATTLRRVYFAGGEPFMQPGHFRMLDLLIETGAAAAIDVVYNSNLTILPDGVFGRLARFRSAGIGASCDGTEEVFERIRVGASWDGFVRNVRTARDHVRLWLQVSPQRDNVTHLGEIVDFAVAERIGIDLTNFVHWPAELSVRNLPPAPRSEAMRYLAGLAARCRDRRLPDVAAQVEMLAQFAQSNAEAGQDDVPER
jgi:pyruvate-formate lyase-activating enzyme